MAVERRRCGMVDAFVLVQVDVTVGRLVGEEIGRIAGVQLAQVVTGPYDVIVRAEVASMDALGALIDEIAEDPRGDADAHLPGHPDLSAYSSGSIARIPVR
jgi:DNA-binding Lrp family transcriptional regulator